MRTSVSRPLLDGTGCLFLTMTYFPIRTLEPSPSAWVFSFRYSAILAILTRTTLCNHTCNENVGRLDWNYPLKGIEETPQIWQRRPSSLVFSNRTTPPKKKEPWFKVFKVTFSSPIVGSHLTFKKGSRFHHPKEGRKNYPPVNKHSNGKSPSWIGNTSSNGGFSIAMLDYRSVAGFWTSKLRNVSWLQSFKKAELEPKPIKKSSKGHERGRIGGRAFAEKNEGSYLEDHPRICKWLIG